ncbi:Agamous-like MADS-box protein AGL75 [Cardamine amara subsp. amara]|uniref:Agamous-like MADS-box protein AGL75 n=1 Tax=Cardamine amara subsp. amara TaxID=228776 RepID=A0ABD0ZUD4_CARAN
MPTSTSSSCNSGTTMSLGNRLNTVFKKANELSILCETEVCVIYYGPDGKLKTWPPEIEKVKDIALRYKIATKRKKSHNLDEFLDKMKYKERKKKSWKKKKNLKYPIFDHYSPYQLSQLIQSLELTLSKLQERLRFVEAMKQRKTNLVYHHDQTKPALNPSQFSLYMYNHEDSTLSQLPLSAAHSNQLTNYENQLMQQELLYGCGKSMLCMDKITNTNFQYPQPYSALLSVQEPALMQQQELYGCHQNMSNVPLLSYTVPHDLSSNYGDVVGTSFSQDMLSSYDASSSSLPHSSQLLSF